MTLYEITEDTFTKYYNNITKAREDMDLSCFINQRKPAYIENGIGYVHIYGTLLHDASPMDKQLGNTDYEDIVDDCDDLIEKGARCIVFNTDSGGGMVLGAVEVAEYIQTLPVPTVAFANGLACSAAYKLISGCSYIIATKSSMVGNIGSITVFEDTSAFSQMMGINKIAFVNDGAIYKSIGHLDSLSEEQKAYIQESINLVGSQFQEHVSKNRINLKPEVFTAATYSGIQAVDSGLIDMVGNEKDVVETALALIDYFNPVTVLPEIVLEQTP